MVGFAGGGLGDFHGEGEVVGAEEDAAAGEGGVTDLEVVAVADGVEVGRGFGLGAGGAAEGVGVAVEEEDRSGGEDGVHGGGFGGGEADGYVAVPLEAGGFGVGPEAGEEG